jgi:uncharacterized protein YbjT (DUF2867 family)
MGKELEHGKNINHGIYRTLTHLLAVKAAGIEHYIFSSLVNVHKLSDGKYHCPHFTDKSLVQDHALEDLKLEAAFLGPAFFMQNFNTFFKPKVNAEGIFEFALPLPQTEYVIIMCVMF